MKYLFIIFLISSCQFDSTPIINMNYDNKPFRTFFKSDIPKKEKKTPQQKWNDLKKRAFEKMKKKNQPLQDKDDVFLRRLWSEQSVHICENCGQSLGTEYNKIFCDHIIEKAKRPELRYEDANIQFLCRACHSNKTNGFLNDYLKTKIADTKKYFGLS